MGIHQKEHLTISGFPIKMYLKDIQYLILTDQFEFKAIEGMFRSFFIASCGVPKLITVFQKMVAQD